eukprot:6484295-Amphidinium_carterae.1
MTMLIVKELRRSPQQPDNENLKNLKQLLRYIKGTTHHKVTLAPKWNRTMSSAIGGCVFFEHNTSSTCAMAQSIGGIPGYKETRGDNVHKHHRLHNFPDHAINLVIHT